jgi:HSF-type DNA-binding
MLSLCKYQKYEKNVYQFKISYGFFPLFRWFRQTKFASFQRQLNIYNFHRITSGKSRATNILECTILLKFKYFCSLYFIATGRDKNAYYHELFLRGKPFLASKIARIHFKGCLKKKSVSCFDPDFYSMPYLPDEDELIQQHNKASYFSRIVQGAESPRNTEVNQSTEITQIFSSVSLMFLLLKLAGIDSRGNYA